MTPEPIILASPSDVALIAPCMLGYWPERSVCVVVVDPDGRVILIMRWHVDAPDVPPQLPLAGDAEVAAFHIIRFGDDTEGGATARIASEIAAKGIPVGQRLVVAREDVDIVVHIEGSSAEGAGGMRIGPGMAEETRLRWGLAPWARSREEYVSDIAPNRNLMDEVEELLPPVMPLEESMRDHAIEQVHDALLRGPLTAQSIARVAEALSDVRVRDTILWDLMHMSSDSWVFVARSLVHIVSATPDTHVASPATLLAILRWQQGDGSRAAAAVERALAADPTYSLADLINRSLLVGLHPGVWAEGLAGLEREACRRAA